MSSANNRYFSYIRVSTLKQGQNGTSLTEQRAAIYRYAERFGLKIVREFEEKETAAKSGRPVFLQMISGLRRGAARGAIIHKIDRSARNLKDWADLGTLIDAGVEVHFANESLDLNSRGGRLSADIQAVVAADYIRNLREETKKGFYGRLKQGLCPMPACLGYRNCGGGNLKLPHPVQSPLVRRAFELYATGEYGLDALVEKMNRLGMRNQRGKPITRNGLANMLHNPFYTGIIRLKSTGEMFSGKHQAIISKKLFDIVQDRLAGKAVVRQHHHEFLFRQLLRCARCEYSLVAERQKGYVYYRCHTRDCPEKTIREEIIEEKLSDTFKILRFSDAEMKEMNRVLRAKAANSENFQLLQIQAVKLQVENVEDRLSRLADGLMDGIFDQEMYLLKKNHLIGERQSLNEKLMQLKCGELVFVNWAEKILELANSAYSSYKKAIDAEKRELCQTVTSNLLVKEKELIVKLNYPFQLIANRQAVPYGSPYRINPRTFTRLIDKLINYFKQDATSKTPPFLDEEVPSDI